MSAIAPLARRVGAMISRAIISAVDDDRQAQALQLGLLADETADGVEHFQGYGLTSVPLPDAEAVAVAIGGTRSHLAVIGVVDRRHRPRGLKPGDVCLYDNRGQRVLISATGIEVTTDRDVKVRCAAVSIEATGPVNITAPSASIDAASVAIGGDGGKPVARIGDTVSGGKIVSGSGKVTAA